jgi:hypothetical protein
MLTFITGLPVMARLLFITSKSSIVKVIVDRFCKRRPSTANGNPHRPCHHAPGQPIRCLSPVSCPVDTPLPTVPFSGLVFFESLENITITPSGGLPVVSVLKKIPYAVLIPLTVFMLLAPFKPMPHVLEKLIMIKEGTLSRPIDIFDLIYHLAPLVILIGKVRMHQRDKGEG